MALRDQIKDAMKARKENVNYSLGHKNERCGLCEYYNIDHSCDKVSGTINPDYWCELFERE